MTNVGHAPSSYYYSSREVGTGGKGYYNSATY
jgi:hypothetical protein